jgi:uncharacterized membrane protein YgcG
MRRLGMAAIQAVVGAMLLVMPGVILAQSDQAASAPPIGQQMIREGTLAIDLQQAFGLGTGDDEVEAESRLSDAGITPRNGWVADYPVTPDVVGELYKSVRDAATAGKLSMSADEALQKLTAVLDTHGLTVRPADAAQPPGSTAGSATPPPPPPPGDLPEYYAAEGPPIVTYYAPPPTYYSMYGWVPYPFWWSGVWFSGFFILNDFHRPVVIRNRSHYISNHFRDIRRDRVFRIDPYQRYRGKTYSGIGVRGRNGIPTGIRHSDRTIFNRRPEQGIRQQPGTRIERAPRAPGPGRRIETAPPRTGVPGRTIERAPRSGGAPGGRIETGPRGGTGRSFSPPAGRGGLDGGGRGGGGGGVGGGRGSGGGGVGGGGGGGMRGR